MGLQRPPRAAVVAAASLAFGFILGATPAFARGQGPATSEAAPAAETPPRRVAVIGASASAGFGCVLQEKRDDGTYVASFRLADMLRLTCPDLPLVTTDSSSGFFFNRPVEYGTRAVSRAIEFRPDAVVALDFLFWYCYGNDDAAGQRLDGEEERLEKFERGLAELARLEVPVLVGDLPDMSPAVGGMLSASQMPAKETLSRCNERLRRWAAERPKVVVLPLARMQSSLMRDGSLEVAGATLRSTSGAPLLQRDRLHPTFAGTVALLAKSEQAANERFLGVRRPNAPGAPAAFEDDPAQVAQRLREAAMDGRLPRRAAGAPRTPANVGSATPTP